MQQQLVSIHGRRDAGLHSLGEIGGGIASAVPREQLGTVLGTLESSMMRYLTFISTCRVPALPGEPGRPALATKRVQLESLASPPALFPIEAGYFKQHCGLHRQLFVGRITCAPCEAPEPLARCVDECGHPP